VAYRALASVAATVFLLAGCSGDAALSIDETMAIGSIVDAQLTLAEQRCVLNGIAELGVAPAAIVADTITDEQRDQLFAVALECVNDPAQIEQFVDSFIEGAAESGTDLTRDEARCAIRALEQPNADSAVLQCLESSANTIDDFGDDPVLDLLWNQCATGNSQACDELAIDAPVGTVYERFGLSCAGSRTETTQVSCFDEFG